MFSFYPLIAQTFEWEGYGGATGIKVVCDTPGISVYLNGTKIGVTPINNVYPAPEGWHWVSLFPAVEMPSDMPQRAKDIMSLGRTKVLVRQGEISTATLIYRNLDVEADELSSEKRTSSFIGYSMFLAMLLISIWGLA